MKINIGPRDKFELSRALPSDGSGGRRIVKARSEALKVYPYFVLCRKVRGGYRECFGWHQLREARRV